MDTAREIHELVDERPELEAGVRTVLAADEPFTFDELDLDSGTFGEIAASNAVEKTDDGAYRVTDRNAVRRGLAGDLETQEATDRGVSLPTVDRTVAAALGGALLLVVAFRLVSWPSVVRDGVVVLSGNDPYFYRYWVEQLLVDPDASLGTLPGGVTKGEPLLVVTLWAVTELVGGTRGAAGQVLAWYPVVSAVLTGILLYLLAAEVSDDRRVGLAAVALLAVVPGHAMRTSLGFADHHAFDYLWLALTALSLVVLAGASKRRRNALGIVGLSVGIAGQTLAWTASPLLLVPVALTLAAVPVIAVYQNESPLDRVGAALVGIAGGVATVWLAHVAVDWQPSIVAAAPLLLLVGGLVVTALAEVAFRRGIGAKPLILGELVSGVTVLGLIAVARPSDWNRFLTAVSDRLFFDGAIAETQNLLGPSFGWLLLFGFVLVLAVPYLAWATRTLLTDDSWAAPVAYGWYLTILAIIQIRFVGELSTFAAVFAGLGFVHLAERVDVARPPVPFDRSVDGRAISLPEAKQLGALIALFLLVGGLAIVQVPVKTNQLTTPGEVYETAAWMSDYSDERGWSYPNTYVFSEWSRNRVYNYFVSGESRSYRFARLRYDSFRTSTEPQRWYEQLRSSTGFIVYTVGNDPPGSVGERLEAFGSRTENESGLAHYRAVHVSETGEYRVFTLVPGATITGAAAPNTTLTVRNNVTVDGTTFVYEREVVTDSMGNYSVTVQYPGTYSVGARQTSVPERAVTTGGNVTV